MPISAPWTTWWQDDLPSRFSPDDAIRNRDFLTDLFGYEWLLRGLQPQSKHPLISEWMTNGANAFLLLNALAEDARLLISVPRFGEVVRDLKDGKFCKPSWHVIRVAAMFQRAGAAVCKFYEQNANTAPDFLIEFKSIEVNVEAKLLVESDLELAFHEYANPLKERVFTEEMGEERVHPPITIIIKSVAVLPNHTEVVHAVSTLLHDSRLPSKVFRSSAFNVFVDSPPAGSGLFRSCYVLCPRSERENLRVETRVSAASRQLLSDRTAERQGIFCLGITRHQDAVFLSSLLKRRFDNGEYAGVSDVFLLQSGTHLEAPRRTVIDYAVSIVNPKNPLPGFIPVKALDLCADLIVLHSSERGLPAYRVGAVETRVATGMPALFLPDIRRVDQRSLE